MNAGEQAATLATETTASEAVVATVADREGVDPTELPTLYRAIDTDALDALFADGRPARVSFTYAGHEVTVCGRDQVTVICEPASSDSPT